MCLLSFLRIRCRIKSAEQPWVWVTAVLELKSKITSQSSADKRESWDLYLAAALNFAAAVHLKRQSKTLARLFKATYEAHGVFSRRGLTSFMSSLSPPLNQLLLESLSTGSAALPRMSCMITHVQRDDLSAGFPTPIPRNKHPQEKPWTRRMFWGSNAKWVSEKRSTNDGGETCPQPQVALTLN